METKYEKGYTRCKSCRYCKEVALRKGNEIIAVELQCTNDTMKKVLNDDIGCVKYEYFLDEYNKRMEKAAEMARTYEQTQEDKREKEYKKVKAITEKYNTDNVNHPKHYANSCSIECIDAMQATFGTKDLAKYCIINAYKYLWRYKNKNGKEDLNKAEWYLNKFDELLEESDNKPYSERIPSRYVNVCITLRKWLKMANTALGGDTVNEE